MCHTIKVLISNSPRKLKFSQCLQAGNFDFSHQGHALVPLYVQFLCSDWSRFDRWVNAENLCSMHLETVFTLTAEADRGLCQLVMFLTVFFHWVCKVKFSCYQESSVTHGWFVYWVFGFSLVKVGNPISEWHRFRFSPCLMRKRVEKSEAILALLDSFQCISNGKPE